METPTLTKKQQQKAFSSKKKETLKNLVTTPFNSYWPLLKDEDLIVIQNVLNEHLKMIKPPKLKLKWKEIKEMPKDERKALRLESRKNQNVIQTLASRDGIVFGINDITKLLEKDALASVLIASDVNPRLMVRHIVDMAITNNVPVIIVSNLRETLKSKTGIKGMVVGFKRGLKQDSDYSLIHEQVKTVYGNYPVPKWQINYCRQKLFDTENVEMVTKKLDLNLSTQDKSEDLLEDRETFWEKNKMEAEQMEEKTSKDYYLYRTSKKVRAFVPSWSDESTENVKKDGDSLDFISFESDGVWKNEDKSNVVENRKRKNEIVYRPLVVKRVKSNKNRLQRKIEIIKKKK